MNDKVAHFGLYLVLGLTMGRGATRGPRPLVERGAPAHGLLLTLGLLWAVSDEWHQSFVPGRDPSAGDFAADAFGLLVGYALALHLLRSRGDPRGHDTPGAH